MAARSDWNGQLMRQETGSGCRSAPSLEPSRMVRRFASRLVELFRSSHRGACTAAFQVSADVVADCRRSISQVICFSAHPPTSPPNLLGLAELEVGGPGGGSLSQRCAGEEK